MLQALFGAFIGTKIGDNLSHQIFTEQSKHSIVSYFLRRRYSAGLDQVIRSFNIQDLSALYH